MGARDWIYLVAAAGHLTLAVLCLRRVRSSPVARPLAFLSLNLFGLCFAPLAHHLTDAIVWDVLDAVTTAMCPPLALHLIATFVGARKTLARVVLLNYVLFASLAISSLPGLFTPWGLAWVDSSAWADVFLVSWVPTLIFVLVLLLRHLVSAEDPAEKARTRIVLAALAVSGIFGTADIVWQASLTSFTDTIPRIAPLATLTSTLLIATAALRFRLFDRDLSASTGLYAVMLAVAGVFGYLVLFRSFGGNVAALTAGAIAITIVLGVAAREVFSSLALQRERADRLAVLGRFSDQMAHDLKNPLATIKGALQFLQEEHARGQSLSDHHEFLGVMMDQVERLHRVVDDYQRIGRVRPVRRPVDVNQMVRSVLALEPYAVDGVKMCSSFASDLPPCDLDSDLVSGALQNVIRNALEAMPNGGTLMVCTSRQERAVVISVEDVGSGMDARQAERAFDEFYTTKLTGSGLGLAFVRRVAQAHGGDVSLRSRVGIGTIVSLRLEMSAQDA